MKHLNDISARDLSETIGAIYDCALEPDRWSEALRRITELTSSAAMGMGLIDHKYQHNVRLYDYGYSEDHVRTYFERYAKMNPTFVARLLFPVGEPVTPEMMVDERELLESRMYQDFLKPRGFRYAVTIELLRTDHRSAGTTLMRKEGQHAYTAEDLELLRLLSPHLCRAVAISDALDLKTLESATLQSTLDNLSTGVYLTMRDGRIVYMNAVAERQSKAGNGLRIVNNRLSLADPNAQATLIKAIDEAAASDPGEGSSSLSLSVPNQEGGGYLATVLPIVSGRRKLIMGPFAASAAVFVQDPSQARAMPGEAFASLYKLTGGELRVLLALAQGLGAKEVADMLGIGEATVRTHLQRLFSKTATSRQADLIQLLQSSVPPVRLV